MVIDKKVITIFILICVLNIFIVHLSGCNKSSSTTEKIIDAGTLWEIGKTNCLSKLTIHDGAVIKSREGKSLTMTVDGVETPIEPGSYKGDIILTPATDIVVEWNGMGAQETYKYRAAIYIDEKGYSEEKSVASAAVGGEVTDTYAMNIKITSVGEKFNGIMVTGDAEFSINNPIIQMTGNGANDFAGFGASIMTDGKAEVTIENAKIYNTGAVRPAIWVGGDSSVTVNNAEIVTHSGTLPDDYSFSWVEGGLGNGKFFMEVPWMLGCVGNNRSTILMANGRAYYNNSHIKAYGWGALSTDQVSSNAVLSATDCLIETVESGYGSFADGSYNTYSGCKFNVVDYGLIMQRGSAHFTDGTVVKSDRLGVMTYSGSTILTIDKGCVFNTKKAVIQVKGGSPVITVDNAELNSENGVIFQAMLQDDPDMIKSSGGGGMLPESGLPDGTGGVGGDQTAGASAPGASGGTLPGSGMPDSTGSGPEVTFKNVALNGDIITSMTTEGDVNVILEKAIITGAITTSIAEHAKGPNGQEIAISDDTDLYNIIGEVIDTYSAVEDRFGMKLSLDDNSIWNVEETSYLTELTVAPGAEIKATKGNTVTMEVNGVPTSIVAGTYKGSIVLRVSNM